jgi:hypothetical protein
MPPAAAPVAGCFCRREYRFQRQRIAATPLFQATPAIADVTRVVRPAEANRASAAPAAPPDSERPLVHLTTRCASLDEFVQRFAPFASDGALVIPAASDVAVGAEGRFIIRLKDNAIVMRGRCRVSEIKSAPDGKPGGRAVMRVRLLDMDEGSRNVHRKLLTARRPPPPLPPFAAPGSASGKPAPPSLGMAATIIAVPPPPPQNAAPLASDAGEEPTLAGGRPPSAPPPVEVRAPGASFTLPANPLSDLHAEDLASFIECTLFETDGEQPPAAADEPAPRIEPAAAAPPPAVVATPAPELPPVAAAAAPAATPAPSLLPPPSRWSLQSLRSFGSLRSLLQGPPGSPLRKALLHAAPFALCTVVGVLVGVALHTSKPSPVPPPPAPAPAVAMPAPSSPSPSPSPPSPSPSPPSPAAAVEPPPAPAVAPPAEPAPVPAREPAPRDAHICVATVASEPDGAHVSWGGRPLGLTPLREKRVPCGRATVMLRHERYRPVTREVTAAPGAPAEVTERLHRPPATLVVSSSPPRANITVNGEPLGSAPRKMGVWRFEHVRVQASLPGYLPWSKTVYVKDELLKLNAQLSSAPKADPRGRLSVAR